MTGRHSATFSVTLVLGVTVLFAPSAIAFDNRAASGLTDRTVPVRWSESGTAIGYRRDGSPATTDQRGTAADDTPAPRDWQVGYSDSGGRGPTAVEVKRALGIYQKDPDGRLSRELTLTPMTSGAMVGVKLTW